MTKTTETDMQNSYQVWKREIFKYPPNPRVKHLVYVSRVTH